ncbi:MAG: hypothetical protein R3F41_04910 [Gammaproteobacteria bacterium]|nr:hypothetical protein [Pseudomonadales bacterium]
MSTVVLGARFLDLWKKEEPELWRRWGSPNMGYNFGMYFPVIFGSALNQSKAVQLLKARKFLRVSFGGLALSFVALALVL